MGEWAGKSGGAGRGFSQEGVPERSPEKTQLSVLPNCLQTAELSIVAVYQQNKALCFYTQKVRLDTFWRDWALYTKLPASGIQAATVPLTLFAE